ncbi:MAG TPA: UvrD-helicase domain-containing protein, partial [Ktedonobacterales bacterium]
MERIEVVAQTAASVRARYHLTPDAEHGSHVTPAPVLIERLCDALSLELAVTPGSGVMLGGAYSRLQLWDCARPESGGIIWLRDDLDHETRVFAIAHEIGHCMLHRGEGIDVRPACDERAVDQRADAGELRTEAHRVEEYTPRAQRELEANAFAAELLAPRAEVRRLYTRVRDLDAPQLAARDGISRTLAHRRLVDAILVPTVPHGVNPPDPSQPAGSADARMIPPVEPIDPRALRDLLDHLDPLQREAACAAGPALVVAGPGSGKTATLVGRAAYLVGQRDIPPERLLALTFSNRAAAEMRERFAASGLPGERMHVMTTHAFAAALLREYASRAPHGGDEAELTPDFRILDEANAFLLMEELLATLPLRHYRSLGNPTAHLRALLADFSHARDGLLSPTAYRAMVEAMPLAPATPNGASEASAVAPGHSRGGKAGKLRPPDGMYTAEQIAKARERAEAYRVWDRALRQRGLVDFGGLIQRAVELLQNAPEVLDDVRGRFPQLLVDEFQDTNYAAAELLMRIAGVSGSGLWVVGDRHQSIYRFRGASPGNLAR